MLLNRLLANYVEIADMHAKRLESALTEVIQWQPITLSKYMNLSDSQFNYGSYEK